MVTNNGKRGGNLVGKPHKDKQGRDVGGIKAVVTDAGNKPVELEGGEVIINKEASKKHWKELSRINQSAGNGVPINEPIDPHDEDPEEYSKGGKIEFNPNRLPNKWILKYAQKIKDEHPEIWKLGGNIYGNQAFQNLKRVSDRGYWLDSEEWFYIKWRSFVARHQGDFRIAGVVAMLKWVDKVDRGWQYMKNLIEDEIAKREKRKSSSKMSKGGELKKGIKTELEHQSTIEKYKKKGVKVKDVAKSIAKDHLKEDPKYYSKLAKMEGKMADGGSINSEESRNPSDFGKVLSSSSRFRPYETIYFNPPLIGKNNAKLVSYTWAYEWTEKTNWQGEAVGVRVSDWGNAEMSSETGRNIVHKYGVELPNGEQRVVSSESIPVILGFVDKEQKKVFGNLATASKTLAQQQLKLAIMEAQIKEFDDAKQAIIKKGFPEAVVEPNVKWGGFKLQMGDVYVHINDDGKYDRERLDAVKGTYINKRLSEMGIKPYPPDTYDLKVRIERQKKKIEQILKSQNMASGGEISEPTMFAKGGQTESQKAKIAKVMGEFKRGTLKTSYGEKVTDYDQAIAIALSEAGASKYAKGGEVGREFTSNDFENLKKGDEIEISYTDSIVYNKVKLKVRTKNRVGKGKSWESEKITFENVLNPQGVRFYARRLISGTRRIDFSLDDMPIWNVRIVDTQPQKQSSQPSNVYVPKIGDVVYSKENDIYGEVVEVEKNNDVKIAYMDYFPEDGEPIEFFISNVPFNQITPTEGFKYQEGDKVEVFDGYGDKEQTIIRRIVNYYNKILVYNYQTISENVEEEDFFYIREGAVKKIISSAKPEPQKQSLQPQAGAEKGLTKPSTPNTYTPKVGDIVYVQGRLLHGEVESVEENLDVVISYISESPKEKNPCEYQIEPIPYSKILFVKKPKFKVGERVYVRGRMSATEETILKRFIYTYDGNLMVFYQTESNTYKQSDYHYIVEDIIESVIPSQTPINEPEETNYLKFLEKALEGNLEQYDRDFYNNLVFTGSIKISSNLQQGTNNPSSETSTKKFAKGGQIEREFTKNDFENLNYGDVINITYKHLKFGEGSDTLKFESKKVTKSREQIIFNSVKNPWIWTFYLRKNSISVLVVDVQKKEMGFDVSVKLVSRNETEDHSDYNFMLRGLSAMFTSNVKIESFMLPEEFKGKSMEFDEYAEYILKGINLLGEKLKIEGSFIEKASEWQMLYNALPETSYETKKVINQKLRELGQETKNGLIYDPQTFYDVYFNTIGFSQKTKETDPLLSQLYRKIKNPHTNNENFKSWFANSKVVDSNGLPLKVYHGTRYPEFTKWSFATFPIAYFAENKDYSDWFMAGQEGTMFECYLRVCNPIDLSLFKTDLVTYEEFTGYMLLKYGYELPFNPILKAQSDMRGGLWAWRYLRFGVEWLKLIKSQGYFDGFKYVENNPDDPKNGKDNVTPAWAVFSPEQIKSTSGNILFTFDSPDIRFERGGMMEEEE